MRRVLLDENLPRKLRRDLPEFTVRTVQEEGDTPDAETRRAHAKVVKVQWEGGYPAARVPLDHPLAAAIERRIEAATGQSLIKLPTLGGSVPLYLFTEHLHAPVLGVPIVNHDNNQHGANENLRLQNLWDGIEVFAAILGGE